MGLSYDVALIGKADLPRLVAVQNLANLEADAELDLDQHVLEAHRSVYRKLDAKGIDPTLLTNGVWLESAIAYEAMSRIALAGFLDDGGDPSGRADGFAAKAREELEGFHPQLSTGDEGRNALESPPAVGNFEGGFVFDSLTSGSSSAFEDDFTRGV